MPVINPDKSYLQVPLRFKVMEDIKIPDDWLTQLGYLIANDILKLTKEPRNDFLQHFNQHAGPGSTYTLKAQLHESLKVIYATIASPKTSTDQKTVLASKLLEGAPHCAPGFHDRANELVLSLSSPKNIGELLSARRQEIVSQAARQMSDEVHSYNRVFVVAQSMGYGVRPLNPEDIYSGHLSDEAIKTKLGQAFNAHYTLFSTLNSLQEQLNSLVRAKGYSGRREAGYEYADFSKFDNDFLNPFFSMTSEELFISEVDENLVPKILDINWFNLKIALLKKFREERYFIFSAEEEALLNILVNDHAPFDTLSPATSFFPTTDEFVHCLMFFKEWPAEKKGWLVSYYLSNESLTRQKEALDRLEKIPDLGAELKYLPDMQKLYLSLAAGEGNMDKVKEWVGRGAAINPVLGLLISKQKAATMAWLHSSPALRATINQDGMNALVPEGADKGKCVADVWVSSKKGRQWLLEEARLQNLCPEVAAGKSITDWMKQAQEERSAARAGLFTAPNPNNVIRFLQYVAYGQQDEAEAMLKDNPRLLLEKGKVKDYSGRKIVGTALQIALGAEDVRYHDDEECMVEMIQRYLSQLPNGEEEITKQIREQFPEGYERQEKERAEKDSEALKKVVDAIFKSQPNDDCEAALQEFRDYLEFGNKGKGVIKTGKHFNAQLLVEAFKLYDDNYDRFGGSWDSPKNILCWRKVIGYIQRFLPACYAQAFCQGIYYIVEDGKKLKRSLKFRYDDTSYFPLDSDPRFRLGYEYGGAAVGWGGGGQGRRGLGWRPGVAGSYVKQKTSTLLGFTQRPDSYAKSRCVVM